MASMWNIRELQDQIDILRIQVDALIQRSDKIIEIYKLIGLHGIKHGDIEYDHLYNVTIKNRWINVSISMDIIDYEILYNISGYVNIQQEGGWTRRHNFATQFSDIRFLVQYIQDLPT